MNSFFLKMNNWFCIVRIGDYYKHTYILLFYPFNARIKYLTVTVYRKKRIMLPLSFEMKLFESYKTNYNNAHCIKATKTIKLP